MIAVVIVNYRTAGLTVAALESLAHERAMLPALRAVVVDNASGDGSVEALRAAAARLGNWITVLPQDINGGFGWGNNQGVLTLMRSDMPPEFILFLNPDTEVRAGAVAKLLAAFQAHPECGVAGAELTSQDGRVGRSAFRTPSIGREFIRASHAARLGYLLGIEATHVERDGPVDWVSGAAFAVRTVALAQAGLFDDGFFLYFEEIELMSRIRAAGWTVLAVRGAQVMHREGGATGMAGGTGVLPDYWHRARRRYFTICLGPAGADRADRAFRWGARFGKLIGKPSAGMAENLIRMDRAATLPVVPPHIPQIGDAPGDPPAWMADA